MTLLREPPESSGRWAGDLRVRSLLGSFPRDRPAETDPVHALVRRFRAGDAAAVGDVLQAGRAAIARSAALRAPNVAAVVVPGHDGAEHHGLIELVASLAEVAGWAVAAADVLVRRTPVPEAKRRPARDPHDEAASLCAAPESLPRSISAILLVDDVYASGATLNACVTALRRDGWSGDVAALVLAVAR